MIDKIVGEAATKDSCCPDLDYKTELLDSILHLELVFYVLFWFICYA